MIYNANAKLTFSPEQSSMKKKKTICEEEESKFEKIVLFEVEPEEKEDGEELKKVGDDGEKINTPRRYGEREKRGEGWATSKKVADRD